jgi:hypothetical protein
MGMSTHVIGIRPPDAKWNQMKAVWDACKNAGIEPPEKVKDFFEYDSPDPAGIRVELQGNPCVRAYSDDMQQGFEVDITKLPKDVKILRFFNSY